MASTSLPTDDGESNSMAALPTGLRPIEVGELAAQQRDGAGESPPELSAPVPANGEDGNDALSTGVRLADAERIASERLDGAAEGSLKEALAIVPAPRPAAFSLVERIELVDESLAAGTVTPPFEPTTEIQPSDRAPVVADEPEPSPTISTEGSDPIVPSESIAAPSPPAADTVATEPAFEPPPVPAADTPAAVAAPVGEGARSRQRAAPQQRSRCRGQAGRRRQRRCRGSGEPEAIAGAPTAKRRREPCARAPRGARSCRPAHPSPVAPAMAPQPPSLPLHAMRDGSGRTTLRPAMLAPLPPRAARPERTLLDVRGFLAGFALSWAFGVVLYLYMTSG